MTVIPVGKWEKGNDPRHAPGSPIGRRRCRPGRDLIPAGLAKGGRVVGEEGE